MKAWLGMIWRVMALLIWAVTPATAETLSEGLMWNRTGLPAVFPLQVDTVPGNNYVMRLSDPATGADLLAAYVIGGKFFRVLVPPGTFNIRFGVVAAEEGGAAAIDEQYETGVIELPAPLTFRVVGLRVKAGHIIDLTGATPDQQAGASVKPQRICQRVLTECDDSARIFTPDTLCPTPRLRVRRIYC